MDIRPIKHIFILVLLFVFASGVQAQKPRNVILMIGDGMGQEQVHALSLLRNDSTVHMNTFPCSGLSMTCSLNDSVTDSAAGGSALSTGKKTRNGYLAYNRDSTPNETLFEEARRYGKATGFVVSCPMTHATPASFYAHIDSRNKSEDIARQLLHAQLDFAVGGQYNHFSSRKDGQNLLDSLKASGYRMVYTVADLQQSASGKTMAILSENKPGDADERGDWMRVGLRRALEELSRDGDGFVLMVEGSQIDWACHANNFQHFVKEIIEFDDLVGMAKAFAEADGETLVVVTADHETGGMKVSPKADRKRAKAVKNVGKYVKFTRKIHSSTPVKVFAFGPGAENFQGVMDNTAIHDEISRMLRP